ncbi:deoxyribose-phosphate aldolase [Dietzia sp. CH92]|uniref:deoxyribose-phosphate aldolase n=1 Tax=Dietzia sp. CH92 TaxID=3051823 RepID=UPI0028D51A84|nr:deoxyribose-phosphate aldolase [Dietzia sp. CH92]
MDATPTDQLTRARVASMIDHTLLSPDASREDVQALLDEARELGVKAVCVSPAMLPVRAGDQIVATVAGFPSGKHHSLVKAMEGRLAVDQGAREVDMVIDVGAAISGLVDEVMSDVLAMRDAVPPPVVIKVILETAAIHKALGEEAGDQRIEELCHAVARAGADFVKTSTGFHPAGGASVRAVEAMRRAVGGQLGIKASGGIRDADTARAMIAAGATRLGLSGTRAVLEGFPE